MAILFIDGFDYYNSSQETDLAGRWSTVSNITINAAPRNGHGQAVLITGTSDMIYNFPATLTTFHVAFAFKLGGVPSSNRILCTFKSGSTTQLYIMVTSAGTIQVVTAGTARGATTTQWAVDVWHHIAMKITIDNTVGSFELRVDGSATPEINETNIDTQASSGANCTNLQIEGDFSFWFIDDFVFADDTGGQAFLGDYDVYTIYPDGAGASAQFTPSAGSNWQNVDETKNDGDTTYNESQTVGHKDRFTMGNVPADTDTIYAVQVGAFSRKTDVGTRELNVLAYDGTTEGAGADKSLTTAYEWALGMFEDHPTSAAPWTESEVNSMEAGYEVAV